MPIETTTKAGRRRLRWTFDRVIENQRIRRTKILPQGISAKEADELARKWEAETYGEVTGIKPPIVTIGDCVRFHCADKAATWKDADKRIKILEKWAPYYRKQDAMDLHEWSKQFVGVMRSNVDPVSRIGKRPLTDGAIRNTMAYLRAAIKYAHKIGKLSSDQTARMVIPPVNNDRHNYPDRREMVLIARACENREVRAAIRVAFYSGMRKSEIARAAPGKRGFVLPDTKNGRPRIVPIHRKIAVITRNFKFTFQGYGFDYAFRQARNKAGFPHTRFHDLRHGAASEMINSGVDLFTVGGVLGHKTTVSTKRYAHLVTDRLADAISKIGRK
jgi:integrase